MSLWSEVSSKRVIVTMGPGGVGKTTTSAAMAMALAKSGKRVLCLTIDPARRLATSLGIEGDLNQEHRVGVRFESGGELWAHMLDTATTFDSLVRQMASSPDKAERILQNRLYQYISRSLAGTAEYMALEKLHAVREDPRFDVLVLDTPPAANALDFLSAPERLSDLVDSPAMRWMVDAFGNASKTDLGQGGFKVLERGASFLLKGLARITGSGFFEQVAEFLGEFNALFGGFRKRAGAVASLLRSSDVTFLVVTTADESSVDETLFLVDRLKKLDLRVSGVIANRVPALPPGPESISDTKSALASIPTADVEPFLEHLKVALLESTLASTSAELNLQRLKVQSVTRIPMFRSDIHDVEHLSQVSAIFAQA